MHKDDRDFCKLFADIEADPTAKVPMTVRQHILATMHLQDCDSCQLRAKRIEAMNPKRDNPFPERSDN